MMKRSAPVRPAAQHSEHPEHRPQRDVQPLARRWLTLAAEIADDELLDVGAGCNVGRSWRVRQSRWPSRACSATRLSAQSAFCSGRCSTTALTPCCPGCLDCHAMRRVRRGPSW